MLKKIAGFRDTQEAAHVMANIRHRANGAAIFTQTPAQKPAPMSPSR